MKKPIAQKVLERITAAPDGVQGNVICQMVSRDSTRVSDVMGALEKAGKVRWVRRGHSKLWVTPEHYERMTAVCEAERKARIKAQRERERAKERIRVRTEHGRITLQDDSGADYFKHRIVDARTAPPLKIRGPVSVWQLGAA